MAAFVAKQMIGNKMSAVKGMLFDFLYAFLLFFDSVKILNYQIDSSVQRRKCDPN